MIMIIIITKWKIALIQKDQSKGTAPNKVRPMPTDDMENSNSTKREEISSSAGIHLTLSRHRSLSSIASGRSSGIHPVSAQSCCMLVLAGHPTFARPCEVVPRSAPLGSSSLFLQLCIACQVRLALIVFVMSSKWPYSCCFVGAASMSCSVLLAAFLCSCRQAFSHYV